MPDQPVTPALRSVRVAIGALIDRRSIPPRVLLAQRVAGQHLAGLWEYPGGKIEAGESPERALRREFAEELGIAVRVGESLGEVVHDYEAVRVHLLPFVCEHVAGEVRDLQVAAHRWVDAAALLELPTPPANGPINAAVIARLT